MKQFFMTAATFAIAMMVAAPPATSADRSTDRIAKEARHELATLSNYGVFDDLKFQVQGDNVTLLGVVTRPTLKSEAEKAVKSIEGVGKVDNRIEVLPLSPEDDRIRLAVYRSIYANPTLDRYGLNAQLPIHIVVKNGDVTLSGAVGNELDRTVAGTQANGVSGVHSVKNELQIVK